MISSSNALIYDNYDLGAVTNYGEGKSKLFT